MVGVAARGLSGARDARDGVTRDVAIARLVNETAAWGAVVSAAIEWREAWKTYDDDWPKLRGLIHAVDALLSLREGT